MTRIVKMSTSGGSGGGNANVNAAAAQVPAVFGGQQMPMPRFSGKKEDDIDAFLYKAKLIGSTANIADKPLAHLVQLSLDHDAATWLAVVQRESETDDDKKAMLDSFELLAKALGNAFREKKSEAELLNSAKTLKQKKDEAVAIFLMRCRQQVDEEMADMDEAEKKTRIFGKMYLKYVKSYVVKGIQPEVLSKLPELKSIATMEAFEKELQKAAAQAAQIRAGVGGASAAGATSSNVAKLKQELASVEASAEAKEATARFLKWYTHRESKGILGETDVFSLDKEKSKKGKGRGKSSEEDNSGPNNPGGGARPRYEYGKAPFNCLNQWCLKKGHSFRQCRTPKPPTAGGQTVASVDQQQQKPTYSQAAAANVEISTQEMAELVARRAAREEQEKASFAWNEGF